MTGIGAVDPPTIACDLWLVTLDDELPRISTLRAVLSRDELDRAARYVFELHRARFIAARARLRAILASYLQIEPTLVQFTYGPYGKPSIANPNPHGWQFNLSHSNAQAVVAIARGCAVGVDIEHVQAFNALADMIAHSFSATEKRAFAALPQALHVAAFYRGWTCKEAYLKGRGDGLAVPLTGFDVLIDPQQPAALLRPYGNDVGWEFHTPMVVDSYAIALAVHGKCSSPHVRHWVDA